MSLFGSTAPTFSFGAASNTTAATGSTFSFGAAPASSVPQTGFSLGASTANTGFSFGNPAASTAATGFTLGAPVSSAGTSGFSFGGGAVAPGTGGFQLGSGSVASSAAPTFSLGVKAPASSAPTGFSLGAIPQQSTPQISTLGANLGATTAGATFNFAAKPVAAAATTAVAANPGFSFGSAASTAAASTAGATALPTLTLGATSTATSTSAAPVLAPAATTATTGFSFKSGATTSLAASTGSTVTTSLPTLATVTAPAKQMSYKELEDTVEKWLHDLGEQEKAFLSQAAQVNSWDRQLIENGEKVTELNSEVERVKADQQRLDRELDFILSQQEELEDLLQPIEAQVKSQQLVQHAQHSDVERERTYNLAENIDAQLKRMMEDLREIIERINNSNVTPSQGADEIMTQIGKILNSHMDSLQWVDQNTNLLQKRVEDINQLMETRRSEHDRTFHLSYE